MRHLIIDTATEALSVALFENGALIGHHHEITGRGHAEKLIPAIAGLPEGGRADRIWVDSGPGSFTGIRVGLAAARALAFAWQADLGSYSSLNLLAAMAQQVDTHSAPIAIALTGGHGELFWQQFDTLSLAPFTPAASLPIADIARTAITPIIYGTGAATLIAARGHGEARLIYPDARQAMLLPAACIEKGVTVQYGRGADAKPAVFAGSA